MLNEGTGAASANVAHNFDRERSVIFAMLVDLAMQLNAIGTIKRAGSWNEDLGAGWSITLFEGGGDCGVAQAMISRGGRICGVVTPCSEYFRSTRACADFRAELADLFEDFAEVDRHGADA